MIPPIFLYSEFYIIPLSHVGYDYNLLVVGLINGKFSLLFAYEWEVFILFPFIQIESLTSKWKLIFS